MYMLKTRADAGTNRAGPHVSPRRPVVRRSEERRRRVASMYDDRRTKRFFPMTSTTREHDQRHLGAALLLACLAQFLVILGLSVVNVALPSIRHGLHFSEVDLQWVVNAYTVTFGGFLLLGGRAADLLGRRKGFVSGLILFGLASLAGGVADSQLQLIAARAIQGLGGAGIGPASLAFPPR